MHEQAESHVAIDLDNRNPLPMARFESRIAVDRHLFKCERISSRTDSSTRLALTQRCQPPLL